MNSAVDEVCGSQQRSLGRFATGPLGCVVDARGVGTRLWLRAAPTSSNRLGRRRTQHA